MASTTKTQLTKDITSILERNKIELSSELAKELLSLVAIKSPNRVQSNSPLVGDIPFDKSSHSINDITQIYCLRFQKYLPVEEFSKSSKTDFGYSKESKKGIKIWLHYDKLIKELQQSIAMEKDAVLDGVKTVDEAKIEIENLNKEITELQNLRSSAYSEELYNELFPLLIESSEIKESSEIIEVPEVKETPKKSKRNNKEA